MMSQTHNKKRIWPYILAAVLIVLLGLGMLVYRTFDRITDYVFKQTTIGEHIIKGAVGGATFGGDTDLATLLPFFLGFDEPRTYLVLFQNNTELRPSGGFVGVYAVIQMDGGKMNLLKLEGSEILDWQTPDSWKPTPPQPLTDHLGVDRWYFRDSNWSPDFPTAARKALELYIGEGGAHADEIDVVAGITPTVFERLLQLTGSITVEGKTFTPENGVETLEYEVEFAYKERGRSVEERKDIIVPLIHAMVQRAAVDGFLHPEKYISALQTLLDEKHILAYSIDDSLDQRFENDAWTGRMVTTTGDYLMWVDANLGALKTDHAMHRMLRYDIDKQSDGTYLASATMSYQHNGTFDWRTTRYQTYARIFVPKGSRLIETEHFRGFEDHRYPAADQGETADHAWFGTYIRIEPGKSEALNFKYVLPQHIGEAIESGTYDLVVQKQPGTIDHRLTLDLNFGTTVTAATPAETEKNWGDTSYIYDTDLRVDREFIVRF